MEQKTDKLEDLLFQFIGFLHGCAHLKTINQNIKAAKENLLKQIDAGKIPSHQTMSGLIKRRRQEQGLFQIK